LLEAQAALDDWVCEYNASRPHQALSTQAPVTPSERFHAAPAEQRELLALWLPAALDNAPDPPPVSTPTLQRAIDAGAAPAVAQGAPVEVDRVILLSGKPVVRGPPVLAGTAAAGQTVRLWASVDVIHLTIAGARIKSLRSHLSPADLLGLAHAGAVTAGPPPLPDPDRDGDALEVDRTVSNVGIVSLAGHQVLAAEILRGRRVAIRVEPATLMFLDPDTRELLRTRPNPLAASEITGLQGARPAGPPPRPRTEPITVQRRRRRGAGRRRSGRSARWREVRSGRRAGSSRGHVGRSMSSGLGRPAARGARSR
jgi:hypothetical protein